MSSPRAASPLDLTRTGRLSPGHLRRLNAIAERIRGDFNLLAETLGHGHEERVDWWVSDLATRNTYSSPLFTWCCQLRLIAEVLQDEQAPEVILVDAYPLWRAIGHLTRGRTVRVEWRGTWRDRVAWWPRVPMSFGRYLAEFAYARLWAPPRTELPHGPLTLVDAFVFDATFGANGFVDRYYNTFGGQLTADEWKAIVYWPTMHTSVARTWPSMRAARHVDQHFLLTEDVVHLTDYVWAFLFPLRALRFRPGPTRLGDLDITPMVRAVWFRGLTDASAVLGLLKYRFAMRLKAAGVTVRRLIDWYEGQSVDRGQNIGFRRFHPDCTIVGYQGYIVPRHYLAMYPTEHERVAGGVPHTIAVVGEGFVEDRKEFCRDLDVTVAPAFRFDGIRRPRRQHPDPEFTTVLVPLHMTTVNSVDVLRCVAAAVAAGVPPQTRWWIRPHPAALPLEELVRLAGVTLPPSVSPPGDFADVLEQSDVLVANTSSTCLEAIAKAVPVAVVGAANEPAQNPIPPDVPQAMWALCLDGVDVAAAIRTFAAADAASRADRLTAGARVCHRYFAPVTRPAVQAFLGLPGVGV